MNGDKCGMARELIPDLVGDRLSEEERGTVEQHVDACSECAAELELVRVLFASRPEAPSELLSRLTRSGAPALARPSKSWWGLAAAAVAALALGIGMSSDTASEASVEVPGYAYEVEEGDIWMSDDGLVAGAPHLDDLSDDALLQLLDELSAGSPGGSA